MFFYPGSHWKGRSDGQGSEDMVRIRSLNYFDVPFGEEAGVAKALCCMPVFVDTARVSSPLHGCHGQAATGRNGDPGGAHGPGGLEWQNPWITDGDPR